MNEKKVTGHCIICHLDNVELTDEHVIPDAIGGYIHCYKVCKDCNSRMGDHVDSQLLNHFLIKGLRHTHQLKGKTSFIPNPLVGDGVLETGEKVRVEDIKGVVIPRILPCSPKITPDKRGGKITVDARDEKLIPAMQQKMLKKMGLPPNDIQLVTKREVHQIEKPVVKMQVAIDLKYYKIALLKIAYEICVELFPEYENDALGMQYAEILFQVAHEVDGALDRLDEVRFVGNGFQDPLEPLLSQFIDYGNKKRHIIVVMNQGGHLSCLVKLFDTFSLFMEMSDSAYLNEGDIRICFNDFSKHRSETFTLSELLAKISVERETTYKFDVQGMALLAKLSDTQEVGFCANSNGENLVFNQTGNPIMTEEMLKSELAEDKMECSNINDSKFTATYHFPEGFCFMVSPGNNLVQLVEIKETTEIRKY